MAGIHKIAEINSTINNLCVRIRVIRLWTLPSYGNSSLPYSIEMVWLDEDGGKIHALVKRAFVSRFVNLLKNGISHDMLVLDSMRVTSKLHIMNVHKLPESSNIPRYGFNFVSFDTLNAPDVGYLAGIGSEKIFEKDGKSTKYTVIELEIDDGKIMKCVLFDNYPHELNAFLGSDNKDGAVVEKLFYRIPCVRSHIGWGGERSMPYKGVDTSP
ncbi:hypothetical protein Ahy_B06g081741 [Arachis hypogaea]|uniref:Replication protein A 70 kDa DNA-binding subunit B/D first OB fold domain-containing protein n=1 Tax=Arachis hypogaea TaxID=3818 RepID=A0A444YLT8_ARAHY|nr:hypothetical protein Ahy_B06g081741 [Arachis hypogaea]